MGSFKDLMEERSGGSLTPFLEFPKRGDKSLAKIVFFRDDQGEPLFDYYRSYVVPFRYLSEEEKQNSSHQYGRVVAYNPNDTLHPGFLEYLKDEGKKPGYFPFRGYAYVLNLTGYRAFNNSTLRAMSEKLYANDPKFSQNPDIFLSPFVFDMKTSIVKGFRAIGDVFKSDGLEINLADYIFTVNKNGTGKDTKYSVEMDENISVSDLPEDEAALLEDLNATYEFSSLSDMSERKRYRPDNDLGDHSFVNDPDLDLDTNPNGSSSDNEDTVERLERDFNF